MTRSEHFQRLPTRVTASGIVLEQVVDGVRYRCVDGSMSLEVWIGDNGLVVIHDTMAPVELEQSVRWELKSPRPAKRTMDKWKAENDASWGGSSIDPASYWRTVDAKDMLQSIEAKEEADRIEAERKARIERRLQKRASVIERQRRVAA